MILQLGLYSGLAYFGWSVICLELNVRKARSLNIPVVRLPIDPVNFFWIFLSGRSLTVFLLRGPHIPISFASHIVAPTSEKSRKQQYDSGQSGLWSRP